jgi:photosystem II stability/assembly factor-like uncharacterized protein
MLLLSIIVISGSAQWKDVYKLGDSYPFNLIEANHALLMRDNYTLWRSLDSGTTWNSIGYSVPGGNGYTGKETFETDGRNIFVLYTSDEYDAVYYSADLGDNWNCVLKTNKYTYNRLVAVEGKVYVTTFKNGYYTSIDGGITWQNHPSIIIDGKPTRPQFRHIVRGNGKVFATQYETGVVVSIDGEKTFKTIAALKSEHQYTLDKAGKYLIAGNSMFIKNLNEWKSGIWISEDDGTTWSEFNYNLEPNGQQNDVINAVEHKGTVYLSKGGQVFSTADGFRTWKNLTSDSEILVHTIRLMNNFLITTSCPFVKSLKLE